MIISGNVVGYQKSEENEKFIKAYMSGQGQSDQDITLEQKNAFVNVIEKIIEEENNPRGKKSGERKVEELNALHLRHIFENFIWVSVVIRFRCLSLIVL